MERPKSGRWAVVEEFSFDGYQYRLSRRPIDESSTEPRLTARERQALGYANRGYTNKLIAAALGVAPSTVGVLLYRAAAKVGAKSRRELLAAYAKLERGRE
jgi:DNA-binding CsgD family transcriptional regulator